MIEGIIVETKTPFVFARALLDLWDGRITPEQCDQRIATVVEWEYHAENIAWERLIKTPRDRQPEYSVRFKVWDRMAARRALATQARMHFED